MSKSDADAELVELKRLIKNRCMSNDPICTIMVLEIKDNEESTWDEVVEELKQPTYIPSAEKSVQIPYTPVFQGGKYFYTSGWHEYVKTWVMEQRMEKFKGRATYLLAKPHDILI